MGQRVVICAGGFAPVGGIEAFLFDLATGLTARGLPVSIACWGKQSTLLSRLELAGVTVRRRGWRWGCRWGLPDRMFLPIAKRAIGQADVVLFGKLLCEPVQAQLAALKQSNGGPPFVFVTPYRPVEMWAVRPPSDEVLNSFDAIVTQTHGFADDLRVLGYRGHVRVLPYVPPECRPVAPLPAMRTLRIGFLGRLAAQKNLPYLVRAFSQICGEQQAELHLFGGGDEKERLLKLAAELNLSDHVRLHGHTIPDEVAAAIDTCDLFAFTSTTEGQCLAALEILARGRTIVATPVGVFPELLREPTFGVLAPADDAAGFASALLSQARKIRYEGAGPDEVQAAYLARFRRNVVLNEYARLLQGYADGAIAGVGTCS